MELMINTANILYLLSYFVRDILRLRILTVAAASCLSGYFYCQPEPLMVAVYWNVGFIGLNLFWIARLLLRRGARGPEKASTGSRTGVYSALTSQEHLQSEAIIRELTQWRLSILACSIVRPRAPQEEGVHE